MSTDNPRDPVNRNNFKMNVKERSVYGKPKISIMEVVKYTANSAMLFWIIASLFNSYYLVKYENNNDKYIVVAISMFVTQVVYNWLDLNSDDNIEKLQFYTSNSTSC